MINHLCWQRLQTKSWIEPMSSRELNQLSYTGISHKGTPDPLLFRLLLIPAIEAEEPIIKIA